MFDLVPIRHSSAPYRLDWPSERLYRPAPGGALVRRRSSGIKYNGFVGNSKHIGAQEAEENQSPRQTRSSIWPENSNSPSLCTSVAQELQPI